MSQQRVIGRSAGRETIKSGCLEWTGKAKKTKTQSEGLWARIPESGLSQGCSQHIKKATKKKGPRNKYGQYQSPSPGGGGGLCSIHPPAQRPSQNDWPTEMAAWSFARCHFLSCVASAQEAKPSQATCQKGCFSHRLRDGPSRALTEDWVQQILERLDSEFNAHNPREMFKQQKQAEMPQS